MYLKLAAILWIIREWWHRPNMHKECVKPATFWDETIYYRDAFDNEDFKRLCKLFKRHLFALIKRVHMQTRLKLKLCCNGDGGGWRTRVCDWLEESARKLERRDST